MAAIQASVLVGYRRRRFREAQITFSGSMMVRPHLVAGGHFRPGYAFLCLPQIAFRFTQRVHLLASNDKFLPVQD
jgi:hypothetical protein